MIHEFEKAWEANFTQLVETIFDNEEGYNNYLELLHLLFEQVVNPYLEENDRETYDLDNIHVIDDGGQQGTLLFAIPLNTYQPSSHEYVLTYMGYGSCSCCDSIELIHEMGPEFPRQATVTAYALLCLHMLQRCTIPFSND